MKKLSALIVGISLAVASSAFAASTTSTTSAPAASAAPAAGSASATMNATAKPADSTMTDCKNGMDSKGQPCKMSDSATKTDGSK